jgi:HEAT repeat protein
VALRVQAVEALGDVGDAASFPVLLTLYGQTNPLIRAATVKAAAAFGGTEAEQMMLSAIRDDQARVRLAAVEGIKRLGLENAAPYLLLRAKSDPEQSVRFAAFDALAALNSQEGVDFLLGVVKEKKSADAARVRAAAALLENGKGVEGVLEVTGETLGDDKKATLTLRYALGKELAKRENAAFADMCRLFLASKDVTTQGIGLDIWAKGKYAGVRGDVEAISTDEKAGVNQKKAVRVLGNQS